MSTSLEISQGHFNLQGHLNRVWKADCSAGCTAVGRCLLIRLFLESQRSSITVNSTLVFIPFESHLCYLLYSISVCFPGYMDLYFRVLEPLQLQLALSHWSKEHSSLGSDTFLFLPPITPLPIQHPPGGMTNTAPLNPSFKPNTIFLQVACCTYRKLLRQIIIFMSGHLSRDFSYSEQSNLKLWEFLLLLLLNTFLLLLLLLQGHPSLVGAVGGSQRRKDLVLLFPHDLLQTWVLA